jgi:outer membrane immunogenic protein
MDCFDRRQNTIKRYATWLGAILTAASCSTPVWAADLPLPTPQPVYKAPVVAPLPTWEGFYVGGHVGYGWDPANASFNPATFSTSILGPNFDDISDSGPTNLAVHPQGWLGGGQLGYNWQRGALVYGAEADISWANITGSTSAPFFVNGTLGGDDADFKGNVGLQQKLDYFGTVRGRAGWANNTLFLYGTGGFAWGHVSTTFDTFGITAPPGQFSAQELAALQTSATSSDIRVGFAVGAGLEWLVARNWSVKAEYLFVDLSNSTLVIPGGVAHSDPEVQVARVGFNYFIRP